MPEQFWDEIRMPVADGSSDAGDARSVTPRERHVLAEIMAGASNKEDGRALRISPRTIEVHRARIMEKLGAKNACDLARIVLRQGPRH
jgi:DNA-binding NarL/FixJ family response regulator